MQSTYLQLVYISTSRIFSLFWLQFGGPMRGPFVPGQMGMPPMMPPQMMYGVGIPEAEYASYFPPTAQVRVTL